MPGPIWPLRAAQPLRNGVGVSQTVDACVCFGRSCDATDGWHLLGSLTIQPVDVTGLGTVMRAAALDLSPLADGGNTALRIIGEGGSCDGTAVYACDPCSPTASGTTLSFASIAVASSGRFRVCYCSDSALCTSGALPWSNLGAIAILGAAGGQVWSGYVGQEFPVAIVGTGLTQTPVVM